ncbi:MAG: SIR2 family protein [Acidobacteriota bacterium]
MNFPTNILLTGAGFTKNFGGLLASEIWSRLFNDGAVRKSGLAKVVSAHAPDFERAYQELVRSDPDSDSARVLHGAVVRAFDEMDLVLRTWYHTNNAPESGTLTRLFELCAPKLGTGETGLLFTLNQDLYPERKTFLDLAFGCPGILAVGPPPGLQGSYFENHDMQPVHGRDIKRCPDKDTIATCAKSWLQPGGFHWVKLHGSCNWRSSDGRDVMVLGHDKTGQIASEPLLTWYWKVFREALGSARHRLIVIGYSFRDPHVNEVIARSIQGHGTELVVIDPTSWEVLEARIATADPCYGPTINERLEGASGSRHLPYDLVTVFSRSEGSTTPEWKRLRALLEAPLP